ncbi:MAG: alpha/beta hydrolase [Planctomycetota bacterium]|jgi:acetyl esterase/lipase
MRILFLLLLAPVCLAERGYLGARLQEVEGGVRLERIVVGSPAAKAGLRDGDIVTGVDAAGLAAKLKEAGKEIELRILRDGKSHVVRLTVGVHPQALLERPDPSMGKVKVTRDLAYGTHERHKVNLFEPVTDEQFPVVLWIHAGAWSMGGRENETALAMRFAERGIGFAAISYRLSSKVWWDPKASKEGFKHPAHAEDCALAFAWLRTRYPKQPLFISGHSCGAHLAALLAMDPRYLKKHGLGLKEVRGVVAIGGAYDIVKYHAALAAAPSFGKERADAHLHWIFGESEEEWIAASPATYLEGCTMPMVIVGEKGQGMRIYHEDFRVAVKKSGVTSIRFVEADDRTHGQSTPFMSRKHSDPVRDMMIGFIRRNS